MYFENMFYLFGGQTSLRTDKSLLEKHQRYPVFHLQYRTEQFLQHLLHKMGLRQLGKR